MPPIEVPAPLPEPPLIERARRIGWLLLALSVLFGGLWRYGGELIGGTTWAAGLAVACGLLGLLAIVNVALVRGLYRQLPPGDAVIEDQSM
jgi:hypothetical protein